MQSNFQILQSQALMVFICMHWTVFNTSFNGEKCFHLSVRFIQIFTGGLMDTTQVIGSLTCILCLYILCLMLITLTEWFCTVV